MAGDPDRPSGAAATDAHALLYGPSPGWSRFPLGDTTELAYCPYDRARHVLSAAEAAVLQACQSFATLDEHARRSLEAGKLDATSIHASLDKLVGARLLVAQQDLVARCVAHRHSGPAPAQIASVCIPTRNRPEMLQRCVESYIRCALQYNRRIDLVVVDSSDDATVRERNVEALLQLKRRYGAGISYIGPEEKQDFARRLAAQGVDPCCADFAIRNPEGCPNDTGANRNALLLATVGECTVQVDDDTVCRVMPWIARREGVRITSRFNPTEFAFLDEGEAFPAQRFETQDFFGLHESLLGQSVGTLVERHGLDAETFDRPSARLLRRIERGGGRVALTALGVAGDSGMSRSAYFLQLEGEARASLLRSERVYRGAMSGHRLIRAVPRLTVVDAALCMTLNLGIDNRRLLPPFMPVQRLEDDIFEALLRACAEGGSFGFLPWALMHDPPPRTRPSLFGDGERVTSGQVILALVRSFSPIEAMGVERNLQALGRFLGDWGRGRRGDLEEFIRLVVWRGASQHIAQLEGLLQKHQRQPRFWADDADRYIAYLQSSATHKDLPVPRDLEAAFGPDVALERLQKLISALGDLLKAWSDLRDAAGRERARGNPAGRRL
jgi:hypothetical protein